MNNIAICEKTKMRRLRDKEFIRHYRATVNEMLNSGGTVNRHEAVRRTIESGTPHYYLSFDRAYSVVAPLIYQGRWTVKLPLARRMWQEIADKALALRKENPDWSLPRALTHVLTFERASRFYLSEPYAYKLLYRIVREQRESAANH